MYCRLEAKQDLSSLDSVTCEHYDIDIDALTKTIKRDIGFTQFHSRPTKVSLLFYKLASADPKKSNFIIESDDNNRQPTNILEIISQLTDNKDFINDIVDGKILLSFAYNRLHVLYPLVKCLHTNNFYLIMNYFYKSVDVVEIEEDKYQLKINHQLLKDTVYLSEELYNIDKYDDIARSSLIKYVEFGQSLFDFIITSRIYNKKVDNDDYMKALYTFLISPTLWIDSPPKKDIAKILGYKDEPIKSWTYTSIISYLSHKGYNINVATVKSSLYKHGAIAPQLLSCFRGIVLIYLFHKQKIKSYISKELLDIVSKAF